MITTENHNVEPTTSIPSADPSESLDLSSAFEKFQSEHGGDNGNNDNKGSGDGGEGITEGIDTSPTTPAEPADPSAAPASPDVSGKPTAPDAKGNLTGNQPTTKPTEADSIQEPVNLPKRDRGSFKHVKQIAQKWELAYRGKEEQEKTYLAELNELRQKVSNPAALPETVAKELEELRFHRALYDVENSPEFKKGYDEKISQNDAHIYKVLEGSFNKEHIDTIKSKGGISNYVVGEEFGDDKGKRLVDTQFWNDNVMPTLTPSQRKLVEGLLGQNEIISLQKREALNRAPELRKEYFENYEKIQQEQRQQTTVQLQTIVRQMEEQNPWVKPVEILATDSPAIKAQKEAQNKYRTEVVEPLFDEALALTREDAPPETRAQLAGFVVKCDFLGRINENLYKELQTYKAENNKLKGVKDQIRSAQSMKPAATIQESKAPSYGDSFQGLSDSQETAALLKQFAENR